MAVLHSQEYLTEPASVDGVVASILQRASAEPTRLASVHAKCVRLC